MFQKEESDKPWREDSDETDTFVLTTRVEELLKGCSSRLDIHIEKGGLPQDTVTNRFDQAKRIGATDLRTIKASNGLIPAPHTLKEGDSFGSFPSEGRKGSTISKHLIEVFSSDHIFNRPYPYSTF